MKVYICEDMVRIIDAPPGLILLDNNQLICKSEYVVDGNCECIIVASGEYYCGGNEKMGQPVMVQ